MLQWLRFTAATSWSVTSIFFRKNMTLLKLKNGKSNEKKWLWIMIVFLKKSNNPFFEEKKNGKSDEKMWLWMTFFLFLEKWRPYIWKDGKLDEKMWLWTIAGTVHNATRRHHAHLQEVSRDRFRDPRRGIFVILIIIIFIIIIICNHHLHKMTWDQIQNPHRGFTLHYHTSYLSVFVHHRII